MKNLIAILMLMLVSQIAIAQSNLLSNKAKQLVAIMTTEEKVSLLVGKGMKFAGSTQSNNGVGVGLSMEKVEGAAGTTNAIERLGILLTVVADGPAGLH